MKTAKKVCLLLGVFLTVGGALTFWFALRGMGYDWSKFDTQPLTEQTFTVDEPFDALDVRTVDGDVRLAPASDGVCIIVCASPETMPYTVDVADGVLTVRQTDSRTVFDHLTMTTSAQKREAVLYLPQTALDSLLLQTDTGDADLPAAFSFRTVEIVGAAGDIRCLSAVQTLLRVQTSTGDVTVKGASAETAQLRTNTGSITAEDLRSTGRLDVTTDTGEVTLGNVSFASLGIVTGTGDAGLRNVTAVGKMTITTETGDVLLQRCGAAELAVTTNTGDVTGSLDREMIVYADSDTGDVQVPRGTSGGRCDVVSDTGDILLTFADAE